MSASDPLRELLRRWKSGDQSAADELYQRYEQRVLRLAEKKLGNYLWRRVSPDDIMMMAMKSLLRVTVEENCTLDRNQSLWGLVVSITDRKILKEAAFHAAAKRNVRKETEVGAGASQTPSDPIVHDTTPEDMAQLADLLETIRSRLKPDDFTIVAMRLEGLSNPEIANQLGVAHSTITRKLQRIEDLLYQLADVEQKPGDRSPGENSAK